MAPANGSDASRGKQVPVSIPPMTVEEEDSIILARITNDERPLKRVIKKFHAYASLAAPPIVPPSSSATGTTTLEDAKEAFLVELRAYQLALKKSAMICDAETRQVEEYQREKERIDEEHVTLREQIEELKVALEHAQMLRRRKIEYDQVTEKVNSLPSREELELSIAELENDMAAIRVEHDAQNRVLLAQKSALDIIVTDLAGLRFIGKDKETMTPSISAIATPLPDTDHSGQYLAVESSTRGASSALSQADGSVNEDEGKEEGEDDGEGEGNGSSRMTDDGELNEGDIEMGEVEEEPRNKKLTKAVEEELEEGEASDFSSELSDPPDD
ncbi:hypothetical protein FA13DRAFT_1664861 [Coprinellus micaceus]|uniref:Uncharacterized protein n=1 Tax=Coprinellus micaceus TaxID=71717 RepID=A0A4Y7T987_COPMI|nr:hypothetical protein FA13DRAFT_1664861 [Coprinellus micaceus]